MTIAGTWAVTVKTPMGPQSGTLNLTTDGDSFTGTLSNPMMGELTTRDGRIAGNTLTWQMDMKQPMPMTLDGEATVDGDTLTGRIVAGMFGTMDLTGRRS